jgi:hypothetical protein
LYGQIKEGEMEKYIQVFVSTPTLQGNSSVEYLSVDGKIILKWIPET